MCKIHSSTVETTGCLSVTQHRSVSLQSVRVALTAIWKPLYLARRLEAVVNSYPTSRLSRSPTPNHFYKVIENIWDSSCCTQTETCTVMWRQQVQVFQLSLLDQCQHLRYTQFHHHWYANIYDFSANLKLTASNFILGNRKASNSVQSSPPFVTFSWTLYLRNKVHFSFRSHEGIT